MSNKKLVFTVYRSLFRIARKFDRNPFSKAFLYRNQLHVQSSSIVDNDYDLYGRVINRIFRKRSYFHMENDIGSLASIVGEEFRRTDEELSDSSRLDVALIGIKKLSSVWNTFLREQKDTMSESLERKIHLELFSKLQEIDPSNINEKDIVPGVLLVAHPLVHGPFKRAVVLILEQTVSGTYGVVINRKESHNIGTAVRNLPSYITESFGNNPINFGGMIRRLQVIHSVPEAGGRAIPSCQHTPLFSGTDIKTATQLVKTDPSLCSKFRFFVGCCVWTPEALTEELEAGYWLPCHAPADTLLADLTLDHKSSQQVNMISSDKLWSSIICGLGPPLAAFGLLPDKLDSSVIPSVDW